MGKVGTGVVESKNSSLIVYFSSISSNFLIEVGQISILIDVTFYT